MSANLERRLKQILGWRDEDLAAARVGDYSGRGMYGRVSSFAFQCDVSPRSTEGRQVQAEGMSVDSLGAGSWIYYTRD